MASANGPCRQCGYEHYTEADVLACNAIHGRVLAPWPEVRDPRVWCALCGIEDHLSELLWHFKEMHGRSRIRTGTLVRYVSDVSPL